MASLNKKEIEEIKAGALDENGKLKIVPSSFYAQFPQESLSMFCVLHGFYLLPTIELAEWIKGNLCGKSCEIGAGNGRLAKHLEIDACDNFMQNDPMINAYYRIMGQPTVPYGDNVIEQDANDFLEKNQYNTVLACWVTHHASEGKDGSAWGVREIPIVSNHKYILIGNNGVHQNKGIMMHSHEIFKLPFIFSRSRNASGNFAAIWDLQKN